MAYLIEPTSKQEQITAVAAVDKLDEKAEQRCHPSERGNHAISRSMKEQKLSLIALLSCFPATAFWLLKKYQQDFSSYPNEEDTNILKSDLMINLAEIKQYLGRLIEHKSNKSAASKAKTKLTLALKEFPYSFDDLTQLVDLITYTFKLRGLCYQPANRGKDVVLKRLEGLERPNRIRLSELNDFFDAFELNGADEQLLFLSAKAMGQLFHDIVVAESLWLVSRQKLAQANHKLVLFIANQYKASFLDFEDLVQEGQTGLLKAVDRFDHQLGFQFSTYAGYWIRQAISRSLSRCERVVRIPCGQIATINKVYRAKEELIGKTGVEPSAKQLASYTGLTVDEINTLLAISQTSLSLESSEDEENSFAPIDYLEQYLFNQAFESMAENELEQFLNKAIQTLTPREMKVVCSHFGLAGDQEMTLQEIGSELNLTRERIRQIQVSAFNKIKLNFGQDLMCFL